MGAPSLVFGGPGEGLRQRERPFERAAAHHGTHRTRPVHRDQILDGGDPPCGQVGFPDRTTRLTMASSGPEAEPTLATAVTTKPGAPVAVSHPRVAMRSRSTGSRPRERIRPSATSIPTR